MKSTWTALGLLSLCLATLTGPRVMAYDPAQTEISNQTPQQLEGIGVTEKLGDQIDLGTPFTDDAGNPVTLGSYFKTGKPVVFSIVYYSCANLCNFHLNGLTSALKKLPWTVGQEFELVALSMDHRETPELAGKKKANYVNEYGRPDSINGWHFLTGSEDNIKKIADQVGFGFRWDEAGKQFAHASAAIIVTPGGKISRYLHGVTFEPQTVRLALLEAGDGRIGNIIDRIVMFCFQFDPRKSKYTIYAWNIMRIGAVLTVLLLAVLLVPVWMRDRAA